MGNVVLLLILELIRQIEQTRSISSVEQSSSFSKCFIVINPFCKLAMNN